MSQEKACHPSIRICPKIRFDADCAEAMLRRLTAKQQLVLAYVAAGYTSKEIGIEFGCSKRTIDACRYRITLKLDIHLTADLTRLAVAAGLVSLE